MFKSVILLCNRQLGLFSGRNMADFASATDQGGMLPILAPKGLRLTDWFYEDVKTVQSRPTRKQD